MNNAETETGVSGTRARVDLWFALASTRNGKLLDCALDGIARERLEALALTIPELFVTRDVSDLEKLWESLGSDDAGTAFLEIVLLSPEHVHVIRSLKERPSIALLGIGSAKSSVGLVLAAVRAKLTELEVG